MQRRVAVDLDGVLHSYTTEFDQLEVISDPPVPGAIEWLTKMYARFDVFIFTTRAGTLPGIKAVRAWLWENGFVDADRIVITSQKLPAHIYVDDRGYHFTGSNFPTTEEIESFQPWHRKK